MWALIRKARLVVALLSAAALSQAAVAAQLQGFVWICGENQQLCYWHKVVVAAPKGWTEDEAWTMRYKAKVMFPNGDKSKSKPVMYVRAHHGEKDLGLDKYVAVAQERWKKRLPGSTIEVLPDRERTGKPAFKVYLYKNPSQYDQAFELTAFTKDIDEANPQNTFFFQIVLSSPSMAELEKAKAAFYDVLDRI